MSPRTIVPSRASSRPWRPRILVYGESGTGKTTLGLELAALTGARAIVIDTEHGTDTYGSSFTFDVVHTDSPQEVEAQVDHYLASPDGYTMLIVDPISCVHSALENQADDELRPKKDAKFVGKFGTVFDPATRSILKRINRVLPAKLRKLDMAQVVTARSKPNWKVSTGPTGKVVMERIGSTWEGDNSLDYEFDIVLEILAYGSNRVARVQKSRGLKLPTTIEEFSAAKLLSLLPSRAGFTTGAEPCPLISQEQAAEIRALVEGLALDPGALTRALTKWGATMIEDLPLAAGDQIIASLTTLKAKQAITVTSSTSVQPQPSRS